MTTDNLTKTKGKRRDYIQARCDETQVGQSTQVRHRLPQEEGNKTGHGQMKDTEQESRQ